MLKSLLWRFLNRRRDSRRVVLHLAVRTTDPEGQPCEVVTEDVSDRGVRLRFDERDLATFVGHRQNVPFELCLEEGLPPVRAEAQLVWTYTAANGGTVCGWQFVHFKGNARRRLRHYLDQHSECDGAE